MTIGAACNNGQYLAIDGADTGRYRPKRRGIEIDPARGPDF